MMNQKKQIPCYSLILMMVAAMMLQSMESLRADERGYTSLFNGRNLNGWKASENTDSWSVKDGTIVAAGPRSHLFYETKTPFKDFDLKVDVMTTPGSNGGIYFHTKFQKDGWPSVGYEPAG